MYYIFATRRHCSRCDLEYHESCEYDRIDAIATVRQYELDGYKVVMIEGRKRRVIVDKESGYLQIV